MRERTGRLDGDGDEVGYDASRTKETSSSVRFPFFYKEENEPK